MATTLIPAATQTTDPEAMPGVDDDLHRIGRRRFTIAVLLGIGLMAIPFLWALWDLWSSTLYPLRGVGNDAFFDLQARAMFHGRLSLPPGVLGIEGFVHDGRQYTYFGIFPSILRMPVLLLTSRFDGDLTAPSLVLAWMMTALFSSLMLWRLRIVTRGRAVMGRAEAASFGVLVAAIMGGSVIVYLAASPFVFSEDFAWSIPLTVGSLFCLAGRDGAAFERTGMGQWRPGPPGQPQPCSYRVRLCDRRRSRRSVVRPRPWRSVEPALDVADSGGGDSGLRSVVLP